MEQEQLNDELTVVGLVLVILFIVYQLISSRYTEDNLKAKVLEAQKVAIHLNNELATTEFELTETKDKLMTLEDQREEEALISQIIKDIATSWNSGRKD